MTETAKQKTPLATLELFGHRPTAARVEVFSRPRSARLTRAALTLLGFCALGPAVFFIPPHIPWVLLTVGAGVYFAYAAWKGAYEVRDFEGACPRCGSALELKTGTKIRASYKMTCGNCHHQPHLEIAEAQE